MEGVRGLHTSLHLSYPSQHTKQLHLDFSKQLLFPQSLP
ncbi:rCG61402, isoform CRA_a [Rattus norvegicus]|uniref:RCG61402, isoform CRA_a n=1 Tax=Rattus norvegicus TaxID=10116 RepID=A6HAB6_RAT|nr:rCG61402, isoform CRA_a [Rattus norvegicus]EDM02971.1 rCG61402, isoform CRA_a [Rattus norvegicus]EDM02972.1 rCG61402, isoform CRA_a [Rattus norvegicus]